MNMRIGFVAGVLGSAFLFGATISAEPATNYLQFGLQQQRFTGGIQHSAQGPNYTVLSADMNLEANTKSYKGKFNPIAEGAVEHSDELYFGVPELYIEPKISPQFGLTIGRQKRTWSKLDEEFSLGVWQPQLRWDYLAPKQQGLTGFFFDWKPQKNTLVTFFASPVHLPDQGPQHKVEDGRFESSNRWFRQPQGRLNVFNSDAPLYYRLNKPSEEETVMNSSFGISAEHKFEGSPIWTKAAYAYKPRNQVHLGIDCTRCGNIGDELVPLQVDITVNAAFVNHHVVTWETGFDRTDNSGWLSLTGDFPNESEMPAPYIEGPLTNLIIAGGAYRHFIGGLLGRPSWLQYSYVHTWEMKEKRKRGQMSEDQVHSSFDRYPFEQVAAVDWTLLLAQIRKNRIHMRNRYSYSIPERGGWLSTSAEWQRGAFALSVGVDVIGADVDVDSEDSGLFSRYRANDRVFGGMSYAF